MSKNDEERGHALMILIQRVGKLVQHNESMKEDFLDALWETYFATRKPEDLATYIDAGGEIDEITRLAVLRALRGEEEQPHGGSDIMDDIEFFVRVKWEQEATAFANAEMEAEKKMTRRSKTKKKRPSLDDIFEEIAPDYSLTVRGAKDKYDRGRKAARKRLGIGQS
jgi:hypothetical protein